ncbi:deoxyribonuclease-1 [Strongylocentrotus purpuratus]|uniref:Deoxyribonuclease n=1 Tax=Strongylocentrotus purpuratus TaxID=7668 RepID=A0A7M7GHV7_STRPU|nr:deoxyribonuclease-1 [Strongylocentrotus purpuratus]|eukprot:XP_003725199.1 PREDICTED: deoxyribonuclease-1 [Strongylocentrotus purpuratus]
MKFFRSALTAVTVIAVICNVVDAVKICAFNIQVLGTTKMGKPEVVDVLTQIITRYDMVLIQEIRDSSGDAIVDLLDAVNSASGNQYSMELGPRVGRSSSKEQYAYFYKSSKFRVKSSFTFTESQDEFEREPYVVHFSSFDTSASEFSVIGLHAKPDDAVSEIDALTDVYEQAVSKLGTSNSILMGDFNADCNYVKSSDWSEISLKTDSRFDWLISDSADTTVKSTDCAYDRIVLAGSGMENRGAGYIFNYQSYYGLSQDEAEDVSDHYPVYFNLY